MSETNGRIDYSRLISDIDFATAFEGTRFEEYADDETDGGVGSLLGGWLGAMVGRFVGMALGRVAQDLLVDELLGGDGDSGDNGGGSDSNSSDDRAESESSTNETEATEAGE
ncbi:MAG: hypothetical protein ACOC0Z_05565, partial [Halohasta sp.]